MALVLLGVNLLRKKWNNSNPASRYLLLALGGLGTLAFLFPPEAQPQDRTTPRYSSSSDKRMYFQNMRSFYYHQDRKSKQPMVIYRLKKRTAALDSVTLPLDIIQHSQQGSAFLRVQAGQAYRSSDSLQVCFSDSLAAAWLHSSMSWQEHFELGGKIYTALENEIAVHLRAGGDTLGQPFGQTKNRRNALIILEDFFNLLQKPSS